MQARKRRAFAGWRAEEETRGLLLLPDYFRIPPAGPIAVPPPAGQEPPAWRATAAERRAWRDRLQARIDHERSLATALAGSVSAAEESTLPALRDALLLASVPADAPHALWDREARLEAQGKWVTDHLLIDARSSPCQKVTRIGQAIETLQALLFSVRTGQLRDTYPFALEAPDFDQEWEWIGSYGAWRAAMFVFLFPENVLRPSLRRRQSPGLRRALELLRTHGRPTPAVARQVARLYADYFQDVANLSVGSWAEVPPAAGEEGGRPVRYYFARNRRTPGAATRVYWGSRPATPAATERTVLWDQIPGLSRAVDLPGAALYQPPSDSRHLYLFARVEEDLEDRPGTRQRLVFTRYNLDTGTWMTQPVVLEQPDDLTGYRLWLKQTADGQPYLGIQPPSGVALFRGVKRRGDVWIEEHFPDSGYQPGWHPVGGSAEDRTLLWGVAKNPAGRLEIFVDRNINTSLWTKSQTAAGGAWSDWKDLGNPVGTFDASQARVAQNADGQTAVVVELGGTHDLWYIREVDHEAGTWSAWENLGNPSPEGNFAPEVGRNANGLLDVFISGSGSEEVGKRLWRKRQKPGGGWEDWKELAPVTDVGISWKQVARNADGRLEILVIAGGSTGKLWRSIQVAPNSESWTPWELTGLPANAWHVVVGENQNGLLEAFVISFIAGSGAKLYHSRQTAVGGPWGPWLDFGLPFNPLTSAVGRNGDGCLDFFIIGPERTIWHRRQTEPNGTEWTAWHNLTESTGGKTESHMHTVLNAENRLELFRRGPELAIWSMVVPYNESQVPNPDADLTPVYAGPYELTERLTTADLQALRGRIRQAYEQSPAGALLYLEEAWYALPVEIALELQRQGHHTAALDWFRTVYDYGAPSDQRKIFHGLELDAALPAGYGQAEGWLEDPLDPHAIAATRRNAHTRFTLMSLVGSLREFADAEFTLDTPESLARARTLYLTGLELLADLRTVQLSGSYEVPQHQSLAPAMLAMPAAPARALRLAGLLALGAESLAAARAGFGGDGGNGNGGEGSLAVRAMAPAGPVPAPRSPQATTALSYAFWVPVNPVLEALRLQIELNLYKLRTCRNIAGLLRDTPLYSAPIDTVSGLPVLGVGGQIVLPGAVTFQPTPYRFAVLLERARQLANLAQQMESALLGALERRDAEAYSLIRARQDVAVANSQVRWHDLKVQKAGGDAKLAELQLARSELQAAYYRRLLDQGDLAYETQALQMMQVITTLQGVAALFNLQAAAAAAADPRGGASQAFGSLAGAASSAAAALGNEISRLTTLASYERRRQEWAFQESLARQEVLISTQQIASVNLEVRLVQRERDIAKLQADNAAAAADFLAKKFTNYELYDWMSGVLRGVYAFFLQQATAMAKLAARQLAFERQETPPAFFQDNYWTAPTDGAPGVAAPDRQGMTGSARLLRDLQQLDQHAFTTDRRKLQLTKTISLARLAPVEFQAFRETGEIYFATPLAMFDRDFPGHWLRLIRQVRTSVIALIPPAQGIRATLATTGVTRIVTSETSLGTPPAVNQGARSVALSSPMGATGLFELDPQSDMLAPFEGLGVDTQWRLALPRAANPFDFGTIADVLVTIEYTALDSPVRRPLVIQQLDPRTSGDRPFSFRHQFADQWYDLHNAEPGKPATLEWRTVPEDFPPNLKELKIQEVALYFSRREGVALDDLTFTLRLRQEGHEDTGGPAQPRAGLIDSRRSSGTAWTGMRERQPWGTWELTVPAEALELFAGEKIADVLFVITVEGRTPDWI
ncbi:MAG TPA: neuraminidase-like domain-containing protein [Thermoanaerobaculia bacterium]|nr:neuraminidase-like domain-containing protein [Thermoanaerobaculia bacterium]